MATTSTSASGVRMFQVRLPAELKSRLEKWSAETGVSQNEVIVRLVDQGIPKTPAQRKAGRGR